MRYWDVKNLKQNMVVVSSNSSKLSTVSFMLTSSGTNSTPKNSAFSLDALYVGIYIRSSAHLQKLESFKVLVFNFNNLYKRKIELRCFWHQKKDLLPSSKTSGYRSWKMLTTSEQWATLSTKQYLPLASGFSNAWRWALHL